MKNISKKTKYLISGIMVLVLAFSICGCEKSGESLLSTGSNDESDGNVMVQGVFIRSFPGSLFN